MLQQVVMRKEVWSLCSIKLQSSVEVLERWENVNLIELIQTETYLKYIKIRSATGKICNLV